MIYQIQQTSSQCPQCSRMRNKSNSSSVSSQSESAEQQNDNQRYVIPIKKNMIQNNQYIEQTLNILQNQVQRLKQQNFLKQRKIRKLQGELNKKQYRLYPQNARIGSIYQNQFQGYKKSALSKRIHSEVDRERDEPEQSIPERTNKKGREPSSRALIEIDQIQKKIKEITENKNERIQFLQDQLNKSQRENKELIDKLEQQANDNQWLTKFCLSFISMAGQVSKIQGKQLIQPHASLRKNTKAAWRYFKSFVKEVIQ